MDPRYPTGKFVFDADVTPAKRRAAIDIIGALPAELRRAVATVPAARLDTPYRAGGWTARQVVHHVADSHMNAYIRIRLALTENSPPVKPYDESQWAELFDARTAQPAVSLGIVDGIHARWHQLLASLSADAFGRTAVHPQHGAITVDWLLQIYAWHGRHHIGHIGLVGAA